VCVVGCVSIHDVGNCSSVIIIAVVVVYDVDVVVWCVYDGVVIVRVVITIVVVDVCVDVACVVANDDVVDVVWLL